MGFRTRSDDWPELRGEEPGDGFDVIDVIEVVGEDVVVLDDVVGGCEATLLGHVEDPVDAERNLVRERCQVGVL